MSSPEPPAAKNQTPIMNEDWLATVIGVLIIAISLFLRPIPVPTYGWETLNDLFERVFSAGNLLKIVEQGAFVIAASVVAGKIAGKTTIALLKVPLTLFVISQLALLVAGNISIKAFGLEAVIFSLILGLVISNVSNIPDQWRGALATELYVKIGLVLLGTSIIFSDLLKAGSLGMVQSVLVVFGVWYVAYWICKKFKLDEEISMMLSSAVSICGVSAAIATAGAIKGDPKKLSYVISLVLVTAIPMMIGMPYIARALGFSPEVTGAWLGGTIDTTGAVVAAGTLAGETALKISTVVKFSQNVLLGVAAFAISLYWTYTKKEGHERETPSLRVIWQRFPKFVIGFTATSFLFSFAVSPETVLLLKDSLKSIQTLWFVLAFTSIGFETRFSELFNAQNRKPLYAFLLAQGFNIIFTLLLASMIFR